MAGRRAKRAVSAHVDPPIVLASGVGKAIDGNVLLNPVDVSVAAGRCVVLRGQNGSGKTTLLRILAGILDPSEGTAMVEGTKADERDPAVRRAVAALIGASTAYRDLTLRDHLVLIAATWGRGEGAGQRAEQQLDSLQIGHLGERFPHELSSGQQQLFHLAMVLARPARVVLLDEPEQRLDTHKRRLLGDLLVDRKSWGCSHHRLPRPGPDGPDRRPRPRRRPGGAPPIFLPRSLHIHSPRSSIEGETTVSPITPRHWVRRPCAV